MQITNHTLTIDSVSIDLPKLAVDTTVHVWTVPTEYRGNGYFVSAQIPGQPMEIPACDGRETVYLGKLALEADAAAALQAAKDAATQAARDSCQTVLASLATRFSDLERQTWERQLAEAAAILQDAAPTKAKYPVIGGIIEVTGESFSDFAMAVQANNEAWSAASANVIGQRQKLVAQIKACETIADVTAVETTITLPS